LKRVSSAEEAGTSTSREELQRWGGSRKDPPLGGAATSIKRNQQQKRRKMRGKEKPGEGPNKAEKKGLARVEELPMRPNKSNLSPQ